MRCFCTQSSNHDVRYKNSLTWQFGDKGRTNLLSSAHHPVVLTPIKMSFRQNFCYQSVSVSIVRLSCSPHFQEGQAVKQSFCKRCNLCLINEELILLIYPPETRKFVPDRPCGVCLLLVKANIRWASNNDFKQRLTLFPPLHSVKPPPDQRGRQRQVFHLLCL